MTATAARASIAVGKMGKEMDPERCARGEVLEINR